MTNIVAIVILTIFIVVIYLGFKSSYPPPDQCSLQQVWYKVTLTKNNSDLDLVLVIWQASSEEKHKLKNKQPNVLCSSDTFYWVSVDILQSLLYGVSEV